jgi:integrase
LQYPAFLQKGKTGRFYSFQTSYAYNCSIPLIIVYLIIYHTARHSFSSLITLEAGVPIETVSKMLGHSDIKTTQIYARVTPKKLFEDMDKYIEATQDLVLYNIL